MLSKEEKREIFEGVMSQLSTVVEELMTEREKNIKPVNEDINDTSDTDSDDYTYRHRFMKSNEFWMLAKKMKNQDLDYAQIWLGQRVDDTENDVYSFLFAPKAQKIAYIKRTAQEATSDKAKTNLENKLSNLLEGNEVVIRDIYIEQKDVLEEIKNLTSDVTKFKKALIDAIWGADYFDEDEAEEEPKIEEKPSEEKVEKARNITALLKKISEDDSAFDGVVELFSKIETLAQKHGGNYDYALKAINDRLRLKKKE
jgi:hypothetical protein